MKEVINVNFSEYIFEKDVLAMESEEEAEKRSLIEDALENPNLNLKNWRNFALTPFGLVAGWCVLNSLHSRSKVMNFS